MLKLKGKKINQLLLYEDLFILLCPNVAELLKNVLNRQKKAHLKKEKFKDESFEVARTRNCAECGSQYFLRFRIPGAVYFEERKC